MPDPQPDGDLASHREDELPDSRQLLLNAAAVLLAGSVFFDAWLVPKLWTPGSAGPDGLGNFFPSLAVLLMVPFQVCLATALGSNLVRVYVLDWVEGPTGSRVANGVSIAATLALLGPAAIELIAAISGALGWLAEAQVFWVGGVWLCGAGLAGVAFGLFSRSSTLFLLPAFPICGALYMFS
jgi:hypothetical protein